MVPLVFDTFVECFQNPYYFEDTSLWQLVGAPFSLLLTVLLIIVNLTILNTVLTNYSDMQANGRAATFQFLVCVTVVLMRMKQAIVSFSNEEIVLQTVLFLVEAVVSMFLMKHLTPIEVFVNTTTSVLWIRIINQFGSLTLAEDFGNSMDLLSPMLSVAG